ncbi:hypothetical protein CHS0354_007445 [Potamilus streckersoni]|uniref:Uncharacterized protein n=1 Tax=Potamilus streckersoni TaxID=2493646 RepID=A0AAE0SVI8_9BIVA|nr:hypothetical protein CHS0354_007445 [Potamilus streckersoni]
MSVSMNFRCRHCLIGLLLCLSLLQTLWSDTQWPPFQNHEGKDVNISKLISVAKSIFGVESFCNASTVQDTASLSNLCTCSEDCIRTTTCCPDNPYSYMKQSCLNIAIYLPVGSNQLARKMVDACPYHETHILPICREGVSRSIFDVPVSSKRTRLSYVHRLCALCSMEKDNDLEPWEPVVAKCVSSPSEMTESFMDMAVLKQLLSEGKCVLVYNESVAYDRNCIPSVANENVEGIVDSCNVSGLWDRYDPDIDWACKHYATQFEQFANVFCFICNPDLVSHTSGPLIDTCNVTGYWKENDITIEQGCLHHNKIDLVERNVAGGYPPYKAVDEFMHECVQVMTPSSTPAYQSISTCNVTGQWEFQDGARDILYACERDMSDLAEKLGLRSLPTLDKPFQEFKNIYCYVCNPYKSDPLYTKCNISEQWETYDDQVKNDCENGRREPKWGPFKNFNCFKCNNKGDTLKQVYILKDVISTLVHESYRYIFRASPEIFGELDRINADPKSFRQKTKASTVSSHHITQ